MISITDEQTTPKDQQSVEDRRERIYEMHLKGLAEREIAEAVGVNQSTVSRSLEIMGERNREWFTAALERRKLSGKSPQGAERPTDGTRP